MDIDLMCFLRILSYSFSVVGLKNSPVSKLVRDWSFIYTYSLFVYFL